jgi:hypothetical protein
MAWPRGIEPARSHIQKLQNLKDRNFQGLQAPSESRTCLFSSKNRDSSHPILPVIHFKTPEKARNGKAMNSTRSVESQLHGTRPVVSDESIPSLGIAGSLTRFLSSRLARREITPTVIHLKQPSNLSRPAGFQDGSERTKSYCLRCESNGMCVQRRIASSRTVYVFNQPSVRDWFFASNNTVRSSVKCRRRPFFVQ